MTREQWIAKLRWNVQDATEALKNAVGMRNWSGVVKYAEQLKKLESQLSRAESARPHNAYVAESMLSERVRRTYPETAEERERRHAAMRRRGWSGRLS